MGKKLKKLIFSEDNPIRERLFALIVTITGISIALGIAVDLITGAASWQDLLIFTVGLLLLIFISVYTIRKKKFRFGSVIIAFFVIFVMLPVTFFFSGGIYSGSPIWFIFSVLFISLLFVGKARIFFLISELAVAGVCYFLAYSRPDLLHQSTVRLAHIDSYSALAFLSLAVCVIISIQIELYKKENARSERQKKEIEELINAQSRFFSSMSHEIRTPINTIIGLNEMILREDVSDEVAENAANIQSAGKMLLNIINDILDMTKLDSGSMQLTPVNYRTDDMISELVNMFWIRARDKDLEFRVSVAPDVPAELIGDDVRVKQILINLLNNAVKYTREGSVSLSVERGRQEGGIVNLIWSVTDTGIGIKKENIPYLFTAFKRVDEKMNRHIEGSGLGLSIVKQLADLMGGTVTVNSIYTQGSTFIIELPQQLASDETVGELDLEARHKSERAVYHSRFEAPEASILVVDDNVSNLLVAKKLLRSTKVRVETASSGEEALRLTQDNPYNVIFMDHMMPEMDGLECRRRIIAQPGGKCRESKLIALTANADSESRALYEREGFDGYLTKPISAEALESELFRLLPKELMQVFAVEDEDLLKKSTAWIQADKRKRMVAVATESVADLPKELLDRYDIATIPHIIMTDRGVFRDGLDLECDGLLSYMSADKDRVRTAVADVAAHEAFFAEQLKRAYNVIFIALSPRLVNSGYPVAVEAASSFNNVTVIDSGHLSGGLGMMVLQACRMAEEGKSPDEITARLEEMKPLIQTGFIADSMDYLARTGHISPWITRIAKTLTGRPVIAMKKGKMRIQKITFGSRKRCRKKYIASCFHATGNVDTRTLLINYAGLSRQELDWIREQVEGYVHFENVYFQKLSAATAANCGPGTFGLMFARTVI
ncbi:MAG: DegV family EDD domain-containing protein [Oscillospiraceae bacterium]|nr:DegV family EDD domain-containing protein [Oscillospiraceae bacterium]